MKTAPWPGRRSHDLEVSLDARRAERRSTCSGSASSSQVASISGLTAAQPRHLPARALSSLPAHRPIPSPLSADGARLIVANPTSGSLSIVDITDTASPNEGELISSRTESRALVAAGPRQPLLSPDMSAENLRVPDTHSATCGRGKCDFTHSCEAADVLVDACAPCPSRRGHHPCTGPPPGSARSRCSIRAEWRAKRSQSSPSEKLKPDWPLRRRMIGGPGGRGRSAPVASFEIRG